MAKKRTVVLAAAIPSVLLILLVAAAGIALHIIGGMNNADIRRKAEQHAYLNETALPGQTVFIGDSITEYYPLAESYASFCQATGQQIYNRGISAECSSSMLARMEQTVLNIHPRNLVILMGTNDIEQGVQIQSTCENIKQAIQLTQTRCPDTNIILQAVYPVNENMTDIANKVMVGSRTNQSIAALNKQLQQLAQKLGVTFVDLTSQLSDSSGNLALPMTYDGLHLSSEGYRVVTDHILPLLETS